MVQQRPDGTLELVNDEAFVIVKAAPRRSEKYGETVCCAALDTAGNWVRLYPVSFRQLADAQRFKRWDHIRYRWSKPKLSQDKRSESRRVDPNSIEILNELRAADRNPLLQRCVVTSLVKEFEAGRSLALLKAEILKFWCEPRSEDDIKKEDQLLVQMRAQNDLFAPTAPLPTGSCPYSFKYRFRDDDGVHEGTCQDWETEQTFLKRRRELGNDQDALDWMMKMFGVTYPNKGMALAMGTHRYRAEQWLINGIVRLDAVPQLSLL